LGTSREAPQLIGQFIKLENSGLDLKQGYPSEP